MAHEFTTMGKAPENMAEFTDLVAKMMSLMLNGINTAELDWQFAIVICPKDHPYKDGGGVVTNIVDNTEAARLLLASVYALSTKEEAKQ